MATTSPATLRRHDPLPRVDDIDHAMRAQGQVEVQGDEQENASGRNNAGSDPPFPHFIPEELGTLVNAL